MWWIIQILGLVAKLKDLSQRNVNSWLLAIVLYIIIDVQYIHYMSV